VTQPPVLAEPIHSRLTGIAVPFEVLAWVWTILGPTLNAAVSGISWAALTAAIEAGYKPGLPVAQSVIGALKSVGASVAAIFPGSMVEQVMVAAACQGAVALLTALHPQVAP
jgi:hypothetical protein